MTEYEMKRFANTRAAVLLSQYLESLGRRFDAYAESEAKKYLASKKNQNKNNQNETSRSGLAIFVPAAALIILYKLQVKDESVDKPREIANINHDNGAKPSMSYDFRKAREDQMKCSEEALKQMELINKMYSGGPYTDNNGYVPRRPR